MTTNTDQNKGNGQLGFGWYQRFELVKKRVRFIKQFEGIKLNFVVMSCLSFLHLYKWQQSFIEQIITLKNKISVHKCFGKLKGIGIIAL